MQLLSIQHLLLLMIKIFIIFKYDTSYIEQNDVHV